jgi:polyketide biosynthesis enoyl-CoA hydratase PksI
MAVVHLSRPSRRIAVVEMADRANSNLFTRELVTELMAAFESLRRESEVHAVVVHGYDSVFCAGGTQQELLGIVEGRVKFDDVPLYRLFLDCEVPVIAAMQGHALGGGLAMGLFADVVVLAEESLYSLNFMKYGFTPGMGSTLVAPRKLGAALASEMFFSARGYHGGELRQRGVPFPVVKRTEVIPAAMRLAQEIAEKPLVSLKLLKKHLTAGLAAELDATIRGELGMHEISFAQPEVRRRIETLFGN